MDRYMKAFVIMSMSYLVAGAVLGLALLWNISSLQLRFAHVHLNLLGFMAMMIFGVGYFILPRFSGRNLRWPRLVALHFWSSNVSLVGMVVFYSVWPTGWLACSVVQAMSTALFLVNVGVSVTASSKDELLEKNVESQGPVIWSGAKVADLVDRWPQVRAILVARGIKALEDPGHLEHVRRLGVSLAMLARRHALDETELLSAIATAVGGRVESTGLGEKDKPIGKDSIIKEVIRDYPATEEVFRKFYGEGCFSCPGQAFETIAQSAMMHDVELEEILMELNQVATEVRGGSTEGV